MTGPDNTPVGLVEREGSLLRGMTDTANKPLWVRVLSIILFVFCLVVPGIFFIFVALVAYKEGGIMGTLMPLGIGLLITLAGLAGLKANFKKRITK